VSTVRGGTDGDGPTALLAYARAQAVEEPTLAIATGFAAARLAVAGDVDVDDRSTPTEFCRACRAAGLDRDATVAAGHIASLYERMVFGEREVDVETARIALAAVARAIGADRADGDATPDEQSAVVDTA